MCSKFKIFSYFKIFAFLLGASASALVLIGILLFLLNLAWPTTMINSLVFGVCSFISVYFFYNLKMDAKKYSTERHFLILHKAEFFVKAVRLLGTVL